MHWTEEAYLAFENDSPTKHELYDGEVYAMAGASAEHNLIAGNTIAALHRLCEGRPCGTFGSDQRIHIEDPSAPLRYTYPDAGVACGKWQLCPVPADGKMSLMNPTLLVEVLSPSTMDYDRGEKLRNYQQIPSLLEVLHIWTDRRLVEQHIREGHTWRQLHHEAGSFPVLHGRLSLDALYHLTDVLL